MISPLMPNRNAVVYLQSHPDVNIAALVSLLMAFKSSAKRDYKMAQVADALNYLHTPSDVKGVTVHGDVKGVHAFLCHIITLVITYF